MELVNVIMAFKDLVAIYHLVLIHVGNNINNQYNNNIIIIKM